MYCRIRLKDTNYQEYSNYRILGSSSFDKCLEIYREYVTYKKFDDVVPIFQEEFELPHSDIIGYYDGNDLVAFTLAYKFKSVNSMGRSVCMELSEQKTKFGSRCKQK